MALQISQTVADPTLDVIIDEVSSGARQRITMYTGAIAVNPTGSFVVHVMGMDDGVRLGLYVPSAEPIGPEDPVKAWAEISLGQATITGSGPYAAGFGQVGLEWVSDDSRGGARWPYLSFVCRGGSALVGRYRVTVMRPPPPTQPS